MNNQNPEQLAQFEQFPNNDQVSSDLPVQSTLQRKANKKLLFLVIAGVFFLIMIPIVVYAGYYIYSMYQINSALYQLARDQENPLKVPAFQVTDLDKSSWKTFDGKYIGLSFKYPSNWYEKDSEIVSQVNSEEVFDNANWEYTQGKKIGNLIWIKKYSKAIDQESYSKILNKYKKVSALKKMK